jgi:hypothetical protein
MKRMFSALASVCLFISTAGAQLPSRITVFSEDGNPFYLVVNGIKQNDRPLTNVMVDGLTFPNYKVKVMFENNAIPPIDKNIFTQDADGNPTVAAYRIRKNNKGAYVMNFFSAEPVQPQTFNSNTVPADMQVVSFRSSETVNNSVFVGGSVTTTSTTTTVGTPGGGIGMNVNAVDPVTGEVINMNVGIGMNMGGGTMTTTTTTTTTSANQGGAVVNTPVAQQQNQGCLYPMNSRDFEAAKSSIRGQSFEDTKLSTAKNVAGSNCFSAQQVKDICQLFSFEESKLEFAKFAYARCTERNKYFIINDVFSFSSSTEELNSYISGTR